MQPPTPAKVLVETHVREDAILLYGFADSAERDLTPFGEVVARTPLSAKLKVPRAKVTEICREVLGKFPVTDFNVQEAEIEDVIRQLFADAPESAGAAQAR